jgi:protein TonB
MAVPQPARGADKPPEAIPPPKAKVLDASKAEGDGDTCSEPLVKPKPVQIVQPAYTPDAQEAKIEGKVRVEITISASGEVTDARVIEGLGHGLDEAALSAARASTFTAATRCGQPVGTTFTIGMRFSL